jgi:RND family efflux transporter MFP subunit
MKNLGNILFQIIAVVIFMVIAVLLGNYLLATGPRATRQKKHLERKPALVDVTQLKPQSWQAQLNTIGTIIPSKTVELKSRVSGEIISTNPEFIPGGKIQKGEPLVQVDSTDINLEIKQQLASIRVAEANLRIEEGQQSYAHTEYKMNKNELSQSEKDLMLRVPQRVIQKAELESSRTQLEKLYLELSRTSIAPPFPALILDRNVEKGSFVTPGTTIAQITDLSRFWIQITLPVEELQWIDFNSANPPQAIACVFKDNNDSCKKGNLLSLMSQVESKGRLAQVIMEIPSPLEANPPFLLNLSTHVKIYGREIQNIYKVPSSLIRESDTVWLYEDGKLHIKPVHILYREALYCIVDKGIGENSLLIQSSISAPVEGMAVRTSESGGANG